MKKILITSLVIAIAAVANADYLYWMVSSEQATDATSGDSSVYAYLKYSSTDSNLSGTSFAIATGDQVYSANQTGGYFEYDLSKLTNYDSYYYYVELTNGLRTDATSYADLVSNGYVYQTSGISIPSTLASTGFGQASGTAYNVPEPTSGLLFLVGGMLLGLRRRRQV